MKPARCSLLLVAALGFLHAGIASAALTPLGPDLDANAYANSLRVTTFASGLDFPTGMQEYGTPGDNGILVGSTTGGAFYNASSTGKLLFLKDTDHNGVADSTLDLTPAGGLPGSITAVKQAGNLLFVTSKVGTTAPVINVLRQGATPNDPFSKVGAITLGFAAGWSHTSYALAVQPAVNQPGKYDLLFNIGSRLNNAHDATTVTATTSGASVTGFGPVQLQPESIYRTTVSDTGAEVTLTTPQLIAQGLRNSAGIAIHPTSGDIYFADNGMDSSQSDQYGNIAYSLDSLHRINSASAGVSIPDYGFSENFVENNAALTVHGSPNALAAFAPIKGSESEGSNQIAIAPTSFPAGLNNGVFVGFHGQFNATGPANDENAVVFYNLSTNTYWHFLENKQPGTGHLDGLLSTADSLYLSDITGTGSMFSTPFNTGAIYQITGTSAPWQIADVNNDGHVTVGDLGILATHFNQTLAGGRSVGDLNGDGSVTVGDLGILATYFGQPPAAGSIESFDEALKSFPNLPQSVPEPSAGAALLLLGMPMLRRGRMGSRPTARH